MTTWTKLVAPAAVVALGLSGATWWTVTDGRDASDSTTIAAPLHRQTPDDGSTDSVPATDPAASVPDSGPTTTPETAPPTTAPTTAPATTAPATAPPMTLPTTVPATVPVTSVPGGPLVEVPAGFDVSTWQLCSAAGWQVRYPIDWFAYVAPPDADPASTPACSLFAPFDMSDLTPDEAFEQSYVVVGRLSGYDVSTYTDAFVTGNVWESPPVVVPVTFAGRSGITYEAVIPADTFDANPWGVTEFVADLGSAVAPEVGYVQAVFPMSYEYGVAAEMAQGIAATIAFT